MYKTSIFQDIAAFENNEMNQNEVVEFVARMIKSGLAWSLDSRYEKMCQAFIDQGIISNKGVVNTTQLKKYLQ